MRKNNIGLGALTLVFVLGAVLPGFMTASAWAEDEDPSFNFKLPDQTKAREREKQDEEDQASNVVPLAVHVEFDYPRYQGYLALRPGYSGLTQGLVSGNFVAANLNIAEYVPFSFMAGARAEFTQRVSLEANIGYARFSTAQQNLTLFAINASTANIFTANVDGFYCFHVGLTGLKICPGAGVGVDGFPVFQILGGTNSTLILNSFSDMIVRGQAKLQYPVGSFGSIWLTGGYDLGFLKGASNGITTTSHHSLWGALAVSTPLTVKMDLLVAAALDSKSSAFTQDQDSWTATATMFALTAGVSFKL